MAKRLLSGDQAHSAIPPLMSVSFSASPPARSRSQTCPPFAFWRDELKARYLPSGLQRGRLSLSGLDVSRSDRVPSQRTIQTSESLLSLALSALVTTYATQSPSGETCGSETRLSW